MWLPVIFLFAISSYSALANVCPGGKQSCPQKMTCCKLPSGEEYSCCPFENATCCVGYCCPNGYYCVSDQCQLKHEDAKLTKLMVEEYKEPTNAINDDKEVGGKQNYHPNAARLVTQANNIICPDGHVCSDGQTCCEVASGKYGCCNFERATCCGDFRTCCPEGCYCLLGFCWKW